MDEKEKARERRIRFAHKISLERKDRRISMEELSRRTGINIVFLASIEEGTTDFSIEEMLLLLDVLNIDLQDFWANF